MSAKQAISLAKETYNKWSEHQAPRLGASVAFYSVLSFAPLLVLLTAVIALVFGQQSAQGALINEAKQLIGDRGAETAESLLKNAQKPSSGIFASVVAFATLLFGASGVFTELQDALNVIWESTAQTAAGFMGMIRQRLFSFGMVLSIGFLLLVSLLLSTGLTYIGHSFGELVPMPPFILQAINFVVSFTVITVLFGLMFKYVPAAKVSWRDVGIGAVGTALLFTIGKQLLGLYLGKASVGSTYGAAGSLVAVIVWIYYSAQIFFFGAEFTHAYAQAYGTETEAGAKQPSAQEPAKPDGKAQAIRGEAPKSAAATVSSSTLPSLPTRTSTVFPAQESSAPSSPAVVKSNVDETQSLPVRPSPVAVPSQKTKPRLLMAVGLGFVLGRVFSANKSGKSQPRISH
jgi:membrane protein